MPFRFVFVAVQPGAERALKSEIAREHPELKFAYSRPGFVTFRSSEDLAAYSSDRERDFHANVNGGVGSATGHGLCKAVFTIGQG